MVIKMAYRNLFRQRRRSLLTSLTMFGGFVLAAFVIAWSDGSYNDVINMFTRNRMGHIQIHQKDYLNKPTLYKTILNVEEVENILNSVKGVESFAPRIFSGGLVSVGSKTAPVRLIGIDPVREEATTSFNKKLIQGQPLSPEARHEVILGEGLARLLKAEIGSEAVILSQGADGSIANDMYIVRGIAKSGDDMQDKLDFFLHIEDASELLVLGDRIHEMVVTINSLKQSRAIADIINNKFRELPDDPDISAEPWQVFASSFYHAMKADQQGMWIMLFIIVLIVAVGVLNTVLMAVLERKREYGLLIALGSRPVTIFNLIITETLNLALISIVFGSVLALIINYAVSIHGIAMPEPMVYGGVEFSVMRTEINLRSFLIPALTVLITAVCVSILPALKAVRTNPAETMRSH